MPKLKQPATLEKLAIQALGRTVSRRAAEAIASKRDINTTDLHEYLYGELPDVLSQEVTAHMLAEVAGTLTDENYGSHTTKSVLLAIICHRTQVFDLSNAPWYAVRTLSFNLHIFTKLQTLIFPDHYFPDEVPTALAEGLSPFKCLVHFRMRLECTDDIIDTLGSSCYATLQHIYVNNSEHVTDASFNILLKCRKLTHISIVHTGMSPAGFVDFLRHKMTDDAAEEILGFAVGPWKNYDDFSIGQLHQIPICCPMLKQLEMCTRHVDMESLVGLTKLEALSRRYGDFAECNLDSFLRVRGSNITSLELQNVRSLDLTFVLNHCVNVRTLSVSDDIIMEKFKHAPNTCQNLEVLKISGRFPQPSIEGMLCACVNLTSLFLRRYKEHITDEIILHVLSKNPLHKLTSFTAFSLNLTTSSLNALIEHCPLLEELRLIECRAITDEEVKMLRQKIQSTNQDLRIDFISESCWFYM